jgi:DNA-binding transcriptional LysR family regulator
MNLTQLTMSKILTQQSEFVLTMPRVFVEYLDDIQSLTVFKLPFDISTLQIYLYWHKKGHNDSLNKWIRDTIFDCD